MTNAILNPHDTAISRLEMTSVMNTNPNTKTCTNLNAHASTNLTLNPNTAHYPTNLNKEN